MKRRMLRITIRTKTGRNPTFMKIDNDGMVVWSNKVGYCKFIGQTWNAAQKWLDANRIPWSSFGWRPRKGEELVP